MTWFRLQGDILDINEIFRDLATMVYEQGEMVGKCVRHLNSNFVFLRNNVIYCIMFEASYLPSLLRYKIFISLLLAL